MGHGHRSRSRSARAAGLLGLFSVVVVVVVVSATNNGFPNSLGRTPPRGWRSWNGFRESIDQDLILGQVSGLRNPIPPPPLPAGGDGLPPFYFSLYEAGYTDIGIDDGWEACGAGVNGSFHDANGNPLINTTLFPDLAGLVQTAKSQAVTMGWYMNCCGCPDEHKLSAPHYVQDAAMTARLGFAGLKVDGCGNEPNITAWAVALNATGQGIVLENCNDDGPFRPTPGNCPYNFFRTSIDNAPHWSSSMWNILQTIPFLSVSQPGCWAYPDMLTIGTPAWDPESGTYPDPNCNGTRLSEAEARAQFAAWCVLSAPLVLGFDMRNATEIAQWGPIVAHRGALAVNQVWAGEAGRLVAQSSETWTGQVPAGSACEVFETYTIPLWMVIGKRVSQTSFAAVAVTGGWGGSVNISAPLAAMGFPEDSVVSSYDIWSGEDTGDVSGAWSLENVDAPGGAFRMFTLKQ